MSRFFVRIIFVNFIMVKLIRKILAASFVVTLLMACGELESIKTEPQNITLEAVGPLFEGINTATFDFNFQDVLPDGKTKESLGDVLFKSVKLKVDTGEFPAPTSFTLSIASPNTSMKEFGFLNDVKLDENGQYLIQLTNEQEFLIKALKDKSQTLVVDFNLTEDWYDNYTVTAEIDWDIKLKK